MAITSHIQNLERRHSVLDQLIDLETTRPLPDFVRITQLKKQKLRIKEQLSGFGSSEAA